MSADRKNQTPRRYFKELRFRQIRALVELSRHGSFSGAATALGLSVPSVWQQVRALETHFSVELATANGAKIELTADGRSLVEIALPLCEGFDSLCEVFDRSRQQIPRQLRVATPANILSDILCEPIRRFIERRPEVRLTMLDRPSKLALELLEHGKVDMAIVGRPLDAPPIPQYDHLPLLRYPFQLICRSDHPLARSRKITLGQLARLPLILSVEESSSRMQVEKVFTEAGLRSRLNIAMTAGARSLILTYVEMGIGISIVALPPNAFPTESDRRKGPFFFRDLTRLFGEDQVVLLQRKGRYPLAHIREFQELVAEAVRSPANPQSRSSRPQ